MPSNTFTGNTDNAVVSASTEILAPRRNLPRCPLGGAKGASEPVPPGSETASNLKAVTDLTNYSLFHYCLVHFAFAAVLKLSVCTVALLTVPLAQPPNN